MNFRTSASTALLLLCCLAPSAFAQLTVRNLTVSGMSTGVRSAFTFTVDPSTERLIIEVNNTLLGPGSWRGNIVAFGFNTPFNTQQLGNNGSNVSFSQTWISLISPADNRKWSVEEKFYTGPYNNYQADYGVNAKSSSNGIAFGEKARFVFTFPKFGPSQVDGFFDSNRDLVVAWQDVTNGDRCWESYCDYGFSDIPPTPEPSTYGLMGAAALLGVVAFRRRAQKRAAAAEPVAK